MREWKRRARRSVILVMVVMLAPQIASAEWICGPQQRTPDNWGKGASCSEASAQLSSLTMSDASNACSSQGYDLCGWDGTTLVITGACWWNSDVGMYQVDGYRTFRCGEWVPECNPICP